MPLKTSTQPEEAQVIALKILEFLASDRARLEDFRDITGMALAEIPGLADDPQFLAGVLDYLSGNQSLLLLFTEMEGLDPESVMRARRLLPGASHDI